MSYIADVLEGLQAKCSGQPEFLQAAREVLLSLEPVVAAREEAYRRQALLERLVTPERVVMFRVPWTDDRGQVQVNTGYRVQFSSALGP